MRRLAAVVIISGVAIAGAQRVARADDGLEDVGASATTEQPAGPKTMEAGIFVGSFISNNQHQFYDTSKWAGLTRPNLDRLDPEVGLRYAYFPHRYFGAELNGTIIAASTTMGDSAQIYGLGIQAMAQLPARFSPFANIGADLMHVSSDTLGSATHFPIHAGVGARYFLTSSIAVRIDFRYLRGPSEQSPYTLNAGYGEMNVGLSWIPKQKETTRVVPVDPDPDHDGVLGDNDKCPNEPAPGTPDGCPVHDRDNDGIPDAQDKCPDQPETKNGFQDDDGCPDQLPDSDGDGILDKDDKCPHEAEDKDGFQDADGCPDLDNDNDGVVDAKDKCPNVAGPVENSGCPDTDTDGDGIPDRLDNCPEEKGTPENHGCKAKQLVVITKNQLQILDQVRFQTGTAKLSPASNKLLDNIAHVLLAHLEIWKVKVDGFTDNVGDAPRNQKLSEDRASAVVQYLVKKGVAPERLEAAGHGQDSPIGDNGNAKGRELNRRVEFNIVNE